MDRPRQKRKFHPALRIELLGPLRVHVHGRPLPTTAFDRRQTPALLKFLLTAPGRVFAPAEITEAIWPTLECDMAEKSLRAAVSKLRKVLEPELGHGRDSRFIRKDALGYAFLADGCVLDTREIEETKQAADSQRRSRDWRAALHLYQAGLAHFRGDFLVDEGNAEWARAPRIHWQNVRLELLCAAAQCLAEIGDYPAAIECSRNAIGLDPAHEPAYRQWMLCAYLSGRQGEAVAAFEHCRVALTEIELVPTSETARLNEQIRARRVVGIDKSVRMPVDVKQRYRAPYSLGRLAFVGREQEFGILLSSLETAARGEGHAVALVGEPGIGKTRLAEELLFYARDRGWQTATALSTSASQREPFSPLAALVRQLVRGPGRAAFETLIPVWRTALAHLVPELTDDADKPERLGVTEEKRRLTTALAELLAATAHTAPLAVLIDDVQWADDETLVTVSRLLASLRDARVLIVLTLRAEEAADRASLNELRALLRRPPARELTLDYLAPQAIAAIFQTMAARSAARAAFDPLAQAVHARTQGNPLFLMEVLQTLIASGVLRVTPQGKWIVPDEGVALSPALPTGVRDVILARAARLCVNERVLLDVLATWNGAATTGQIAACAGRDDEVSPELDLLAMLGFVRRDAGETGYRLAHDNIRQALYDALSPARRRELHGAIAAQLTAAMAASPQELARHWLGAEDWPQASAALLGAAVAAIRVYAFQSATALLDETESVLSRMPPGEGRLRAELHLLKLRHRVLQEQGQVKKRESVIAQWIKTAHALGDEAERAQGFLARADLCAALEEWSTAVEWIEQARAIFEHRNDPEQLARCWRDLGYVHWCAGALDQAVVAGEQARALHEWLGNTRGLAGDLHNLAQVHAARGDYAHGFECCERARRAWQSLGERNEEARVLTVLSRLQRLGGNLTAARECAREALALHRESDDRYGSLHCLLDTAALALLLGDADQALEGYRAALESARAMGGSRHEGQALRGLGLLHASQGREDEAAHCLTEAAARLSDAGEPADQAEVCRLLGDLWLRMDSPDKAAHYYADALAYYRKLNDRELQRNLLQTLGHASWAGGRMEAALGFYREALVLAQGNRAAEGAALAALGVVLREAGQLVEARAVSEQALAIAHELGDRAAEANVQTSLSEILIRLDVHDEAISAARAALSLRAAEDGDVAGRAWAHYRLAQRLGSDSAEAEQHMNEARRIAVEAGETALLEQLSHFTENKTCPSSSSNATSAL